MFINSAPASRTIINRNRVYRLATEKKPKVDNLKNTEYSFKHDKLGDSEIPRHILTVHHKDTPVGYMEIGVIGGDNRVAKRLFPNLVKDEDKVSRIHGIDLDEEHQGKGLGKMMYLDALHKSGTDWLYNSQTFEPATNTLKALQNEGLIELHWKGIAPEFNQEGGVHLLRLTKKGLDKLTKFYN